MKKLIFIGTCFLLVGCSDSQSVFNLYEQSESAESGIQKEAKEVVHPKVLIHSPTGVSYGYVIHVDKNKKYIATVASAVSSHPLTLVETSTGQIVEGEVIGINKEDNIAILFTKLTAPIEAFLVDVSIESDSPLQVSEATIKEENQLLAMTTTVSNGTTFIERIVPSNVMDSLLKTAIEHPISYEERIQLKEHFAHFPTVMVAQENAVATYEKDTFTYNPDELLLFINAFQQAINRYFETKNEAEISHYVASDDLKSTIYQLAESDGELKQFGSVKLIATKKEDFQYIVEGKTSLSVDEEVGEITGTFKCILLNGEWKLISINYK